MERMYTNGCSNVINILIWKKLKLASYHLNGKALYWHQNYIRSSGGQGILWEEYVPRFGGQKDLLEELMDLR
jgi:hypothetical protein